MSVSKLLIWAPELFFETDCILTGHTKDQARCAFVTKGSFDSSLVRDQNSEVRIGGHLPQQS